MLIYSIWLLNCLWTEDCELCQVVIWLWYRNKCTIGTYNHKSETHKQNLVLALKPKSRNSQLFLRYAIALILLLINPLLIDIMLPFTTLTLIILLGYILICHKLNIFCERRCSFSLGVHQDFVEHSPLVNWRSILTSGKQSQLSLLARLWTLYRQRDLSVSSIMSQYKGYAFVPWSSQIPHYWLISQFFP